MRLKAYSYLFIPLLYLLVAILLDMVMYLFMGLPFASHYFYSLAIMLTIAALACLTQRKWLQITFLSILLALQVFTCAANVLCYRSLNEIFSLESISSIVNAVIASKSSHIQFGFILALLAIVAVYVVGVIIIVRECRTPIVKRRFWQPLACFGLMVVVISCNVLNYVTLPKYATTYVQNISQPKFIYDTFLNRVQNLQMFGSYSYYANNLGYLLGWKKDATDALAIEVNPLFQADAFEYDTIPQMQTGENLIMILMETFEQAAIHPLTMPNLYQFMRNSCTAIDGYYALERTCTTDYLSQTGMHVLGKEMWSSYGDVEIPFSLANLFKKSDGDYVTRAFHNNKGSYYGRAKMFTQSLGFDQFYDYTTLSEHYNKYFNANKDALLFGENLTKIAPADQDFYSYIISISTHGISSVIDLRNDYPAEFAFIDEHLAELAPAFPWLKSPDTAKLRTIKNYLAGCMSFDQGFGQLLDYLQHTVDQTDAQGRMLIETTAIVMFGDHFYYMTPGAVNTDDDDPSLIGCKCPFIIYNPHEKTGRTVEHFASTMDIYKTVCSLFGVITDQQLTYGHSVLTHATSIGVGYLNGYIWGKNSLGQSWRTSDFLEYAGATPTVSELNDYNYIARANQTFSSIVANMNLYRHNGFKDLPKAQEYALNAYHQ